MMCCVHFGEMANFDGGFCRGNANVDTRKENSKILRTDVINRYKYGYFVPACTEKHYLCTKMYVLYLCKVFTVFGNSTERYIIQNIVPKST